MNRVPSLTFLLCSLVIACINQRIFAEDPQITFADIVVGKFSIIVASDLDAIPESIHSEVYKTQDCFPICKEYIILNKEYIYTISCVENIRYFSSVDSSTQEDFCLVDCVESTMGMGMSPEYEIFCREDYSYQIAFKAILSP